MMWVGSTSTRCCRTTDWARARGAYCRIDGAGYRNNGWYWTRSPCSGNSNGAWNVCYDGGLYDVYGYYVTGAEYSVRLAITLKLS